MKEKKEDKKKKIKKTAFDKSEKIKKFLDTHCQTQGTKIRYKYLLKQYFNYYKINNIDEYIKDTRQLEKKDKIEYLDKLEENITKYWRHINKITHGKTPYGFLSAIKMFLTHSKTFELDHLWQILQRNGHGNNSVTHYDTPTKDQLRKILSNADAESKAIILTILTSGQRENRILALKWDDIELDHEFPRLFFRTSKTNRIIKTRITPEAKEALLDYKEQKNKFIEIRRKRGEYKREQPLDLNKVFPMNAGTLRQIWRTLCKNADLYILDKETNKPMYGIHSLRRYFKDNFTSEKWADIFTGHIKPRDEEYLKSINKENKIDEMYKEHSKNLYIYWNIPEHEKQVSELQETTEKQAGLIDKLEGTNRALIIKMKQLYDRIEEKENYHTKELDAATYMKNNPKEYTELIQEFMKTGNFPIEKTLEIYERETNNKDKNLNKENIETEVFKELFKTKKGRKLMNEYKRIHKPVRR